MLTILAGIVAFSVVTLLLVSALMLARAWLLPAGLQTVTVNGGSEHDFQVAAGTSLLQAMTDRNVLVPAACGGQGTCGACRVKMDNIAGAVLATETVHLSPKQIREGWRLACQVKVKSDVQVELPPDTFGRGRWQCTVISARNVATFIRELALELPGNDQLEFRAGSYIQIECPPHHVRFANFRIGAQYRADWERFQLFRLESRVKRPHTRAYSLANYPGEKGLLLNVRIATPPPGSKGIPPGIVSSYLFSVVPGDTVTVSGPFGEFWARDTSREMLFIGGGAGMAPMRAHIMDQLLRLRSGRTITYWYGARSLREAFYVEEFDDLAARHENFQWHLALSEPLPEDHWTGPKGFVHQVVFDDYLRDHPAPEDLEYYLCGPPMMLRACRSMLYDLGVESDSIAFDEF